jgi:serine/threonine-protein phosphatase 5
MHVPDPVLPSAAGDIVDRGPWGLEGLLLLSAYKLLLPNNVYLVRGNHETKYCAEKYGKPQL